MIKDIKPKTGNIDVVGEITDIMEPREFSKFGKPGRVATATLKDDSGTVSLTLWNEQIDEFKVGDKVHLTEGWAGEWQGEVQLSTGRNGKLEKVE